MASWLPFTKYVLQKLHEEGYKYFVFENSPKLNELFPLGKEKITVIAKYVCKIYPYKLRNEAENKAKEKEENYILHYDEPIVSLAKTAHFVAVIVI